MSLPTGDKVAMSGGLDSANISGVIKLNVDEPWKKIVSIDLVSLDEEDIEVNSEPDEYKDYPDYD
ncbi:MAG: hypothetical protein NTZ48_04270 [Candidatus Omnitrophica bacterium]|nr:hypothetical protein [Candidatus Omnitrophota bacterium]